MNIKLNPNMEGVYTHPVESHDCRLMTREAFLALDPTENDGYGRAVRNNLMDIRMFVHGKKGLQYGATHVWWVSYTPKEIVVGRRYHCSWARSRKMSWRLLAIEGDVAVMETPITHKPMRTQLSSLRNTNQWEGL